jgi:hypothetical protein
VHAIERTEQGSDFWPGQHDWETLRTLGTDHILQPAEILAEDTTVQKD